MWTRVFRAWLRGWPEMCARAAREKKSGYFRAAQGLNHLAGELVYARTPPGSIAQAAQAYSRPPRWLANGMRAGAEPAQPALCAGRGAGRVGAIHQLGVRRRRA